VLAATVLTAAPFDPTCRGAEGKHAQVQREFGAEVAAYAGCIAEAFGRDDCAPKFAALAEGQKRFVRAVADVRARCSQ